MIAALLLAAAAAPTAIDAEHAFARDAQRIGQWTAFRKWADSDAVMFTPQAAWARDFLGPEGPAQGDQLAAGAQLRLLRRAHRGQHRTVVASRTASPAAISPLSGSARRNAGDGSMTAAVR